MTDARVQPLLKWVGGRRQLLPQLRRLYAAVFNRYIEPFFGSGAVFFDLQHAGRLRDHDVVLADAGDFLYIDPPCAPVSRTSSFIAYTSPRFDEDAQRRLQTFVISVARRGCHVLLSNSTAPEIRQLCETNADARAVGLRTLNVPARRAVNRNAAGRGALDEFLITNIDAEDRQLHA